MFVLPVVANKNKLIICFRSAVILAPFDFSFAMDGRFYGDSLSLIGFCSPFLFVVWLCKKVEEYHAYCLIIFSLSCMERTQVCCFRPKNRNVTIIYWSILSCLLYSISAFSWFNLCLYMHLTLTCDRGWWEKTLWPWGVLNSLHGEIPNKKSII